MTDTVPWAAVGRFNGAINGRDADALASLMTDGHASVDSDGTRVDGREACLDRWREFSAGSPDYENAFEPARSDGGSAAVVGHPNCADGPALWTAEVRDGRMAEWRVDEDTAEGRRESGVS